MGYLPNLNLQSYQNDKANSIAARKSIFLNKNTTYCKME